MPMQPTNLNERRDLALAYAVDRLALILKNVIGTLPTPSKTEDANFLLKARRDLGLIHDSMHENFLGD